MLVEVVRMIMRQKDEVDTWKIMQVDGRVGSTSPCDTWPEVDVIYITYP